MIKRILAIVAVLAIVAIGTIWMLIRGGEATLPIEKTQGLRPALVAEHHRIVPTMIVSKAAGWPKGAKPIAAPGLKVTAFATGLDHPRWLLVLPNGDVLVAESNAPSPHDMKPGGVSISDRVEKLVMGHAGAGVPSPDKVLLLRDTNGDGIADQRTVFLSGVRSPFGMALANGTLYVAATDALWKMPYRDGDAKPSAAPVKVTYLPGGSIDHHWTKNVIAAPDGSTLYVTVGSNSNVGENGIDAEQGRAQIWQVDAKTGAHRTFAWGIRNPNGMFFQPVTHQLWVVSNERDELGSDIVPDYLTSVRPGGFYGWPWYYWGDHPDRRPQPSHPDLARRVIAPDYAMGPHVAALGLAWSGGNTLGANYATGAFVGEHGSWNRKPQSGYGVVFVPFGADGKPTGALPRPVLTGFLNGKDQAQGRPVGVVVGKDGALLVADDVGNGVWRVTAG